jgi:hypothetical protein
MPLGKEEMIMTKQELLEALRRLAEGRKDAVAVELDHEEADGLLLRFIDDPEVTQAFQAIEKWYS